MSRLISLLIGLVAATLSARAAEEPRWVVEQLPGGRVEVTPGQVRIKDEAGCTVWWTERLRAPLVIRYELTMIAAGGPLDRVSDANCFFLATDPAAPDGRPFGSPSARSGRFSDYDSLRTYYVGMGGNENSTTRFRRYRGDGTKPLRTEHDLQEARYLLEGNRTYRIEIRVGVDGLVEYRRDGEVFFSWHDPEPLREGWFALRTVKSHQVIRGFSVTAE